MHTHTHMEGDMDWLRGLTIAYVRGAELRCKVFHYLLIRLQVGLKSDKAPPFSQSSSINYHIEKR